MLFIYGAGKHGDVVLSVARASGEEVRGFVDGDSTKTRPWGAPPVFGTLDVAPPGSRIVVAIGDNSVRRRVVGDIRELRPDLEFAVLVHPSAVLSEGVEIGIGTVVMPNAIAGAGAKIGAHCILSSASVLEHHSRMGDYSSLGPGATTGGSVRVGKGAFVCLRAAIKHGVSVGDDVVVGACSYVHRDVGESNVVVYGAPARFVRHRKSDEPVL